MKSTRRRSDFARLRALGRSRSQQSTGLLLCPARPSNPFLKKKFPVSMRREISWPARRDCDSRACGRLVARGRISPPDCCSVPLVLRIPSFKKEIPRLDETRNFLARSKGFEPPIFRIGICCVIQLRHERNYQALYYTSKFSECQVRRPFFSRVKSTALSRPHSVRRRATRLLSSLARARRISHTRRGS